MNRKVVLIAGCLVLALMVLGCIQQPTASEILKNMQKRYQDIESYRAEIHQKEVSGERTAETNLIVYFKKPDKYRIEYPSKGVVTAVNDGVLWSYNKQKDELRVRELNASFTDFPFGFILKEMEKYDMTLAGEEEVNGLSCYVLNLKPKGENPLQLQKVWIVKGEWYPARIQSRITPPPEILRLTNYTIPKVSTSILEIKMDFNVKISEDLFEVPKRT